MRAHDAILAETLKKDHKITLVIIGCNVPESVKKRADGYNEVILNHLEKLGEKDIIREAETKARKQWEQDRAKSSLLDKSIEDFNLKAKSDSIYKEQLRLTKKEVVEAIRAAQKADFPKVSDGLYKTFKEIADTENLPRNAIFQSNHELVDCGDCVVDSWEVRIGRPKDGGGIYYFTIRTKQLGQTRSLGAEADRIENVLRETPALPGRYRLEDRVKELRERAAKSEAGAGDAKTEKAITALGGKVIRDTKAMGTPISSVNLKNTAVTDADLRDLGVLRGLQTLALGGTKITDTGLKDLAALKHLQYLDLSLTKVTDVGIQELAGLRDLQALYLVGTNVTDAALKGIGGLKNLKYLDLGGTKIADAGLKELGHLKSLTDLKLNETKVTDVGLKELAGIKTLKELDLNGTNVTDAGLKEIAGMTHLDYLALQKTRVTDAGLRNLAELKHLRTLDLSRTGVTGAGLKELADLKTLQTLALEGTKATDKELKEIARFKGLRFLNLSRTSIADAGLKDIGGLKNLDYLALNGTMVTDAGLTELVGLKNLKFLHLLDTKVTAAGIAELRKALPKCEILH